MNEKNGLSTRLFLLVLTVGVLTLPHSAWAKWYLLASVHPALFTVNINCAVMMVAEKAATVIAAA